MWIVRWIPRLLDIVSQRVVQVGLLIAAVIVWWKYESFKKAQRKIGAKEVIDHSIKQGKINEAAADEAHTDAARPGAAERLRNDPATCRDC